MSPVFERDLTRSGAGTPDPRWRVSRTCDGGACVEVGQGGERTLVRDKADPGGPVLEFTAGAWRAFTAGVKDGPGRS